MTTTEFRTKVKGLYRDACSGRRVPEFTKLMQSRRTRTCEQCGKPVPRKKQAGVWQRFCTGLCYRRARYYARQLAASACLLAMTLCAQPPLPPIIAPFVLPTANVSLAWEAPDGVDVDGFKIFWGGGVGYTNMVDVGPATNAVLDGLHSGTRYHFTVSAYGPRGESDFSAPVFWGPGPTTNWIEVGVVLEFSEHASGPWLTGSNAIYLVGPRMKQPKEQGFWRARPTIRQEHK